MDGRYTCRICGAAGDHPAWEAREMMFGTRECFTYFQCGGCGCLQIAGIPADMGRYYPSGYFSFRDYGRLSRSLIRRMGDPWRVRYALTGQGMLGRLAARFSKPLDYVEWVKKAGLGMDSRVLDVGCGGGKLLVRMKLGGFAHCEGIDPFLEREVSYPNGVAVHKIGIGAFAARHPAPFDLVMSHHSFEHLDAPHDIMKTAASLLSDRGALLIRVPVADSFAWEHYRVDWFQLDAPRHFYLHTRASMAVLAREAGLDVVDVRCDATPSQFVESELYRRGIPMTATPAEKAVFSRDELSGFAARTEELNRTGGGDQAVFILRRHA